jgi:hypothetical protein
MTLRRGLADAVVQATAREYEEQGRPRNTVKEGARARANAGRQISSRASRING